MHGDFALFVTFTMALVTAFAGGVISRRLGLPSMVGYLFAGLVIGPFTMGVIAPFPRYELLKSPFPEFAFSQRRGLSLQNSGLWKFRL